MFSQEAKGNQLIAGKVTIRAFLAVIDPNSSLGVLQTLFFVWHCLHPQFVFAPVNRSAVSLISSVFWSSFSTSHLRSVSHVSSLGALNLIPVRTPISFSS